MRARGLRHRWGGGGVRAKGRAGKHYSPGRDGAGRVGVRGREREEKTERDPRRGVTLPNHQDGGKARSGCLGSSDRSKQHLCCTHKPRPFQNNSGFVTDLRSFIEK